jgi:UDPglucose 6-dehydrogenase
VVSNPEFLREGVAVDDFLRPDRVVVGTDSEKAREKMQRLYEPFVRQGNPIYFMDRRSSEMTKYAANSYLATRISFMNEIANLCEKVGANVDMVRMGMGSDGRIGKRFLFPGVGYGGSCFPKDVQALFKTAQQNEFDFKILNSVMEVNQRQKQILGARLKEHFDGNLDGRTIAIWGLAFKPETDDIREAPALELIKYLLDAGATVRVYDPEAMDNVKEVFGDQLYYAQDHYDAIDQADALAIMTEWSVFRSPSFNVIKQLLKQPIIFDGRNLFDPKDMAKDGFDYHSIGRPTALAQ